MTLFRAKGLEFDTVIIPGLARTPPARRHELSCAGDARPQGLLLASVGGRGGGGNPVYDYLKWLAATEAEHELGRMLYVGVTRARRRLHLVAWRRLRPMRQRCANVAHAAQCVGAGEAVEGARRHRRRRGEAHGTDRPTLRRLAPPLRRLPSNFVAARVARVGHGSAGPRLPLSCPRPCSNGHARERRGHRHGHASPARANGDGHASAFDARAHERCAIAGLERRIRIELRGEGVDADALDAATRRRPGRASMPCVDDARGRWLFDRAHADAVSEWALAGTDDGRHRARDARPQLRRGRRALDRRLQDGAPRRRRRGDAFLAREVERYRAQLERYARIVRALDRAADPARALLPAGAQAAGASGRSSPRGRKRACSETSEMRYVPITRSFALNLRYNSSLCVESRCRRRPLQRAHLSRTSRPRRRADRADDRQLRRRASRPPGDAVAAPRSRRGPAPAARGAHVRSASARVLRARCGAAAADRSARRSSRRFARSASHETYVARFDARARRADAASDSSTTCSSAQLAVRWVLVGEDFRFGKGRAGDLAVLRAHAQDVQRRGACARSTVDGERASSTADARGARRAATSIARDALLGRPYAISGRVAHGEKRGRSLGFPTANLPLRRKPPLSGIFAVRVHGLGRAARRRGEPRRAADDRAPTASRMLEVFLFDFDETIYGRRVTVEFLHKLRDEEKYDDLDALTRPDSRRRGASPRVFRDRSAQLLTATKAPHARRSQRPTTRRTLNLTDTPFPMRGDLARREPGWVAGMAAHEGLRGDPRGERRDARASSCTTARRTPTATSTSATRSTRSSRTSSSRARAWPASTRRTCPAGIATACRSRCRSRRRTARTCPRRRRSGLPRVRDRADRQPARAVQAPGRARRLGPSVHDDGLQERGRRDPHARQGARKRATSIAA